MKIKVEYINITDRRCILVSDIHAHVYLLEKGLEKVKYIPGEDILIILGDFLEKGNASLSTLHYIMELAKKKDVYVLMGNCDAIANCVVDREHTMGVFHYLCNAPWRKQTLLNEMCAQLSIDITSTSNISVIFDQLLAAFPSEFTFLSNLSHVLSSDKYLFVHAGILQEEAPFASDAYQLMKNDYFALQDVHFEKLIVCGHTPVMNYSEGYFDCNPHYEKEKHILTIDGGCGVKEFGQLNIVELKHGVFSNTYVDDLAIKNIIKSYQAKKQASICIAYVHNKVDILERYDHHARCRHQHSGTIVEIPSSFLYEMEDGWHCEDYTDYQLSVDIGDRIGYICEVDDFAFVKKNGILGWISKECIENIER